MNSPTVVLLKIVLEEVEPIVLRRIEVPLSIRLDRLHLAIQAAMGWTNSHLYEFKAGNLEWGFVDPEDYASRLDATQKANVDHAFLSSFGRFWVDQKNPPTLVEPDSWNARSKAWRKSRRSPPIIGTGFITLSMGKRSPQRSSGCGCSGPANWCSAGRTRWSPRGCSGSP